jgi:hypothetical protein
MSCGFTSETVVHHGLCLDTPSIHSMNWSAIDL